MDIERALSALALGIGRALPVAWMVPVFGGPMLPTPIRLALGFGLGFLCLPLVASGPFPQNFGSWVVVLSREVFVGTVMGFVIACLFRAMEASGRLTDALRGANVMDMLSPFSGERGTPLGSLFLLLAVVVFWEMGGASQMARALARSYEAMPLATCARGLQTDKMAFLVVTASAKLIESTLALSAPVLVSLLIADLSLGAMGRVAPFIPLNSIGMPVKTLLGLGMVLLGLGTLDGLLAAGFRGFLALLEKQAFLVP